MKKKIVSFTLSLPLIGFFLWWYNKVLFGWPIKYWQWILLSIPFVFFSLHLKLIFKYVAIVLFGSSIVVTLLYWFNIVNIPAINYLPK